MNYDRDNETAALLDVWSNAFAWPLRTIYQEDGRVYLRRFTLAERPDGGRLYLHHFVNGDSDSDLHNHPWCGSGVILAGGYHEYRLNGSTVEKCDYHPGDSTHLLPETFHRVTLLRPDVGCWTLFEVGPRVGTWHFLDLASGKMTPWRDRLAERGIPVTEYK